MIHPLTRLKIKFITWKFRRLANRALRAIMILDRYQVNMRWPRWRRRQWWNDFIRSPEARTAQVATFIHELSK